MEPAKAKKKAREAIQKYKIFKDFMVEKAQVVVDFSKLEEFYTKC